MQSNTDFTITPMRKLIKDLFIPNGRIYWLDMLLSSLVGWWCFILAYDFRQHCFNYLLLSIFSSLFLYRAWVFTHELSHLTAWIRKGYLKGFSLAWHMLIGIPLLSPGFMYHGIHLEHHNAHHYARKNDAEYLPFGAGSPWSMVLYPLVVWPMPLLAVVRFLILTPVSFLHPKLREIVCTKFSSAGMAPIHTRKYPKDKKRKFWIIQELCCSIFTWVCMIAYFSGLLPLTLFLHWYFIFTFFLTTNYLRALTAHNYIGEGEEMSFFEQFEDSVNVRGGIFTDIWAPVGTRYHALHHLFPALPYHSLGTAHRRLISNLPSDHPYFITIRSNLLDALKHLWGNATKSRSHKTKKIAVNEN